MSLKVWTRAGLDVLAGFRANTFDRPVVYAVGAAAGRGGVTDRTEHEARVKRWSEMLLARRIARGDHFACARLVRAHHASVYRFLLHLSRDTHTAEDLTQETFAAAWLKAGGFRGLAPLPTWLHRIAYTKFVDWNRRRQSSAAPAPATSDAVDDPGPGPLDRVLAADWARRLDRALARLDGPAREVVVLHYFQGQSYRQLAHVLGQPAGTVKWRLSAALERLRSLIHEQSRLEGPVLPFPAGPRGGRGAAPAAAPAAGAGHA